MSNVITVICPTYNEERNIEKVLEFFIHSQPTDKELIVVDGGSTDRTISIVRAWESRHSNIRLLKNPHKIVPVALNLAIKNSLGDPIIRLDAHTEYDRNYFDQILNTFADTSADIVGGPMRAVGITPLQKAIAYVTSTTFGVGDSKIHNIKFKGPSDHVYLGAWKRTLFEDIGYFDEQLVRNQDDEFHYRAKSLGKTIFINPEIKSYYYPRSRYSEVIKQYFQYGFFKPIVMLKVMSEIKLRHLIPSVFTIYVICLPLSFFSYYYLIPMLAYIITDMYYVLRNKGSFRISAHAILLYPILHLSYGAGVISGFIHRIFSGWKDGLNY